MWLWMCWPWAGDRWSMSWAVELRSRLSTEFINWLIAMNFRERLSRTQWNGCISLTVTTMCTLSVSISLSLFHSLSLRLFIDRYNFRSESINLCMQKCSRWSVLPVFDIYAMCIYRFKASAFRICAPCAMQVYVCECVCALVAFFFFFHIFACCSALQISFAAVCFIFFHHITNLSTTRKQNFHHPVICIMLRVH